MVLIHIPTLPKSTARSLAEQIVGTRVETMTIVPTIDGNLEIPEIAIPWWNIDTDQLQVTTIPAKTLNVGALAGAAPAEQAVSSSGNLEELLAMPPVVDQEMIDEQAEAEYIEIEANWLRYLISAAFLIVLVSIYRLVIWPNQQRLNHFLSTVKNRITERYSPANNERVAFRQLLKTLKRKEVYALYERTLSSGVITLSRVVEFRIWKIFFKFKKPQSYMNM